jgi:hypothetical protein
MRLGSGVGMRSVVVRSHSQKRAPGQRCWHAAAEAWWLDLIRKSMRLGAAMIDSVRSVDCLNAARKGVQRGCLLDSALAFQVTGFTWPYKRSDLPKWSL